MSPNTERKNESPSSALTAADNDVGSIGATAAYGSASTAAGGTRDRATPSAPAATFDARYRYGFAAGSPDRISTCEPVSPGEPCTRTSAPRFSTAQQTRSGANEYGRYRLYPFTVGAANTSDGTACSRSPATYDDPVGDSTSDGEVNAFWREPWKSSDWCRCHPDEKKLGSAGRHMNVASNPRRRQTCLTADRNSTAASAAASPRSGANENSSCPGPHSSSMDRGKRPSAPKASRSASKVDVIESSRTSDRYWYPRSNTETGGGGGVNPAFSGDSGPPDRDTM